MDVPAAPATDFILRKCWQKQPFDTRTKAAAAAKRINNGTGRRRNVSAFLCPCCHAWHIGGNRKLNWKGSR